MSFRTTYILFAILGVTIGVFAVALWLTPIVPSIDNRVFPSARFAGSRVSSSDVVRVEIRRSESKDPIVFVRGDDETDFRMEPATPFRIDSRAVQDLINEVLESKAVPGVDPVTDLADVGLDSPKVRVELTTRSGQELTLKVGETRGDWVYVTSSDRSDVGLAVMRSTLASVFRPVTEFRNPDLFATKPTDVRVVSVSASGKVAAVKQFDGFWRFVSPADFGLASPDPAPGGDAGRTPTGVQTLLDAVSALRATPGTTEGSKSTGYVDDAAADLGKYGLTDEKQASLVVFIKKDPAADETESVLVGNKADEKGEYWYARRADGRSVVTVPESAVRPLRSFVADPAAMRDRHLVRLNNKPNVVRLQFAGGRSVDLFRPGDPVAFKPDDWTLYLGDEKTGYAAGPQVMQNLATALAGQAEIVEFVSGESDAALGLDRPDVVVSLWADGIKAAPAGTKPAADRPALNSPTPTVELTFANRSKVDAQNRVAVRRRLGKDLSEVSVFKVRAALPEVIPRDELAFLSPTMSPLLGSADWNQTVSAVKLDFNGKKAEIVRKNPTPMRVNWEFSAPPEVAGRTAAPEDILNLVRTVNNVSVLRWQSLRPSQDDLAAWGLLEPTDKATSFLSQIARDWLKAAPSKIALSVLKDGKLADVTLSIGWPAGDDGVYVRRSDRDWVAIADRAALERLEKWPLDTTILRLDTPSVKSVKLTGLPVLGIPFSVELNRKSAGVWSVADLTGRWVVNPQEAELLVNSLRELHAVQFVSFKTGATPDQRLDVRQGALQIELRLDDKERPKVTLTIGATRQGRLLAMSDQFPGDVFLIESGQREVLERLRDSWNALLASP